MVDHPDTAPHRGSPLATIPFWLLAVALLVGVSLFQIAGSADLQATLRVLMRGVGITIRVTLISFAAAILLGLLAGIGRTSGNVVARQVATLYIEVVRGIPLLVLILWVGFGLTPWFLMALRDGVASLAATGATWFGLIPAVGSVLAPCSRPQECISLEARGVAGLAVGYGAYIAEIVRAGIESVSEGQREAALSLGMTKSQTLRLVVLPQALKLALPPLGNEFIAMLKDSSLISVLAVPELVQQARFHISRTFQPFEVWNMVALTYLVMTTILSAALRALERRLRTPA